MNIVIGISTIFTGEYEHRVIRGVGHNAPQEAPHEFAAAVLSAI